VLFFGGVFALTAAGFFGFLSAVAAVFVLGFGATFAFVTFVVFGFGFAFGTAAFGCFLGLGSGFLGFAAATFGSFLALVAAFAFVGTGFGAGLETATGATGLSSIFGSAGNGCGAGVDTVSGAKGSFSASGSPCIGLGAGSGTGAAGFFSGFDSSGSDGATSTGRNGSGLGAGLGLGSGAGGIGSFSGFGSAAAGTGLGSGAGLGTAFGFFSFFFGSANFCAFACANSWARWTNFSKTAILILVCLIFALRFLTRGSLWAFSLLIPFWANCCNRKSSFFSRIRRCSSLTFLLFDGIFSSTCIFKYLNLALK
jgi:hypothetical protein